MRVILGSQVLAGAGLAAGITVGALLAEDMLGATAAAGVPAALFTVGSAAAAFGVGALSQRSGRRPGLATGYAIGALGGVGVVAAAALDSVALLFISLVVYGSGTATNLQARYAGADLVSPARRGKAVSTILVATTFGAVAGPNLTQPTGAIARAVGLPTLSGPFLLATVAYALAAVTIATRLRPDPLILAREWAAEATPGGPASVTIDRSRLGIAAMGMVLTQIVMIAVMTMTPVHMRDHGHGLVASGLVISIHIAAMYLPSPISGYLVDRFGRQPVLGAAGLTLLAAGAVGALAPPQSVALLAVALGLLGLGWSFGLVAGSAMVTDAIPLDRRASMQGSVDVLVSLAGAAGGIGSGFVVAATSYPVLSLAGGALALAIVPFLLATSLERAPRAA
jgi:MFS family permease